MYINIRNDYINLCKDENVGIEKSSSSFRPKKLIRCSDMVVVNGNEAIDGYCTLSYSWNWSGDIIYKNEKSERIDNKNHIIDYRQKNGIRLNKTYKKNVYFEDIIQEICNIFKIKYIWFDQKCINQENKQEKQEEIKIMHKIYSNANYTVALVPEFEINDGYMYGLSTMGIHQKISKINNCIRCIEDSEWSKRMWTLEEAIMSKQILFVGRNIYMWQNSINYNSFLKNLFNKTISSNKVLRFAHQRTSTKNNDKIFALINIFHDIIDIEPDYSRNFIDLANDFYSQLIKNDLSIICFGKSFDNLKNRINIKLPSWTGINGSHCMGNITYEKNIKYSIKKNNMKLYINCEYIEIFTKKYTKEKKQNEEDSIPSLNGSITSCINSKKNKEYYRMLIRLNTGLDITHYIENNESKLMLSLVEENCENICILYIKLFFNNDIVLYPVIKKIDNSFWKIIGVCFSATFDKPLVDIKEVYYKNFKNNKEFIII
jgi:hypothetical protein